jgi:hypothetical protein
MTEPLLGLYLVAVRGFSVVAAGTVLAVYALGPMVSQILALPEPGRDWHCACFGDENQKHACAGAAVLPEVISPFVSGPSARAFWRQQW